MSAAFRSALRPGDPARIEQIVRATGFFNPEEIGIAAELAEDGLAHGRSSHYGFELVERNSDLVGYACFGKIPCTAASWDLYWICVLPSEQDQGLGQALLQRAESRVMAAAGSRMYADTSSRDQYTRTRAFYERNGYVVAAEFPDFYAPGDGKVVYLKVLLPGNNPVVMR